MKIPRFCTYTLLLVSLVYGFAAFAETSEQKCYDWLTDYLKHRLDGGYPEIVLYGPDPKIHFNRDGAIQFDDKVAVLKGVAKSGSYSVEEVARTSVEPNLNSNEANTYFNIKLYKDGAGKLVKAIIRSPEHNHGSVDSWENYIVEFDQSTGECLVNRIYGGDKYSKINSSYGSQNVVADLKACNDWNAYWKQNRNIDLTKVSTATKAHQAWVNNWISKQAPWLGHFKNNFEFLADFVKEDCQVLKGFISSDSKVENTPQRTGVKKAE